MELVKNIIVDENDLDIEIEFLFPIGFSILLDSCELDKINWLDFVNKDEHTERDKLTTGSYCDRGFLEISKKNGEICFTTNSQTGFGFTYTVNYELIKDKFIALSEWYKTIL